MTFEVVLSTEQYWDGTDPDANKIKGYDSNYLTITVNNVEPTIKRMEMNGVKATGDGYQFANKLPAGQAQRFTLFVDDPGTYDLTNTTKPFKVRWTAMTTAGDIYDEPEVIEGNPKDNPFVYAFPDSGVWAVTAEVMDKDMDDWSEVTYTVYVTVLDQPAVEHSATDMSLVEKLAANNDEDKQLDITVGYWDPKYSGALDIIVQVRSATPAGRPNPGCLEFDSSFRLSAAEAQQILVDLGDPDHVYDPDSTYYRVGLSRQRQRQTLAITELDGTDNASIYGFEVTSFVINDDVLPTSGEAANAYYLTSTPTIIHISNLVPEMGGNTTVENTASNAFVVAGSSSRSIKWQVGYDVEHDFKDTWTDGTGPGIKITFEGCQNAAAEMEFYVTERSSGTFTPNFGNAQGLQVVTMTVEDKDGGTVTLTYYYMVEASKFLKTYSTGPSGGTTTSALSQRYARMRNRGGLGAGHTFVSGGATFSSAENFELTWNCGKSAYVPAYAFGYKVANPVDNGTLDGMDIAIDTTGRQNKDMSYTDYYDYTVRDGSDGRDSFFYLWILTTLDESGTPNDVILGNGAAPEQKGPPGIGRIPLPTNQNEDGSYLDTIIEAIFAKEWREEDNLGDINQDGIPDAFAWTVWGNGQTLIEATAGVESLAGDLNDLSAGNPDEDFIPGVWQAQGKLSIVNKELASYAPSGYAFNNRLELRGFHYGLNETAVADSAASFSEDEQRAWEAFADANGLDPATPDLTKWSPEPRGVGDAFRMDPTLSDTDTDGFPDGWEYFFWYQAKVWAPSYAAAAAAGNAPKDHLGKPRAGQAFVFERFNPPDILEGEEIPADEVLERFNPCVPLDTEADGFNPDFDRDGLADVEELLIGTNPCHWDTDGDHMCDAWEVMNSLDPLNGKKDGNPDGDFMAYASLGSYWSVEIATGVYLFDVKPFLTKYNPLTGEGDYEMQPVGDPLYADKKTYDESAGRVITTTTDAQNEDGEDNYPLFMVETALGGVYYTVDGSEPGAVPAVESLPVLIHDVVVEGALIASAKLDGAGDPYLYGRKGDGEKWDVPMLDYLQPESEYPLATDTILRHSKYILVHDQVRTAFGFDPRTAWHATDHGYVSDRWDPLRNTTLSIFDVTGAAVDTAAYADYDEYLVMRYRMDYGVVAPKWDDKDMWANIGNYTTMPSVNYAKTDIEALLNTTNAAGEAVITQQEADALTVTANISEYLAQAFAEAGSDKVVRMGHGADTDGDGVPDGWELYMTRNPNAGPGDEEDGLGRRGAHDMDYDGLAYPAEYAGTDSCNAYANCPSIYNNHPGNSTGWFNKFFPTDPDDYDTDGDHICDGSEGAGWNGLFPNGGKVYEIGDKRPGFTFIYGTPQDDPTLTCIRGGGMNPCTVDTDKDAIPDLWEMQHAGVPVNASTRQYVGPAAGEVDVEIAAATFTADGLNAAGFTAPDVVYICGGMDATWQRDACSSGDGATRWVALDGLTEDPLLGTARDMDFDHDGLQNYQEYLVQTLRHLRWDDTTTPLMGRMLDGSTPGFVRMMQNADQFAAACIDAGYPESATNDFNAAKWIELGYFGLPAHSWDMMVASAVFPDPEVMLPPVGTVASSAPDLLAGYTLFGSYISTDPRVSDTDMDGMDDFYELFHGLNPLLGTTTPRPMTPQMDMIWLAYGASPFTPCAFDNSWLSLPLGATKAAADPILYPWVMGASEVDPDGDGLRNDQERITANLTSPMTSHTDPTPLWFTDSSSPNSYVAQYYVMTAPVVALAPFLPPALPTADPYSQAAPAGTPGGYMYSFEENEGYDTDNDWTADGREMVRTFHAPTDPLDFDDPFRRQALYLDGNQSWAQTIAANMRGIDGADFFKQFTVEAWVRPEKTGEQTILERSSFYNYDANNKDGAAIRANFRIGMTEDGNVYGMFDNDDAIESGRREGVSCQTVVGPVLPLNEWSHVALTYDGKTLLLYVDGEIRGSVATSLIPANGVTMIMQEPASTNFPAGVYSAMPGAFFIGGRPETAANGGDQMFSTRTADYAFMNAGEWYQGYVDEIRIWDGARTSSEIADNWKRRMTKEDAEANRLEVYTHVLGPDADSSRNDNDNKKDLTAELVQLYNFSTLPGAAASANVAKTPAGFEVAVAGQLVSAAAVPGFTQNVGWWDACLTKSTVYDDYTVIPWIENTVHHLPLLDGSVVDSFLYNHEVGGLYQPASAVDLVKYAFVNTAMPYATYVYGLDRYWRLAARTQLLKTDPENAAYIDLLARSDWDVRAEFVGTADLVPMGGAFAKICPAMWDGNGVADAWSQTGTDSDGDGLPDWWEERNGLDTGDAEDWSKMVSYNGTKIPAWEAYLRDVAKGMQPDGSVQDAYKATADADANGLLDWWQNIYALATGASGDDDGDGLSNYVEYMLSEVFELKGTGGNWLRFAPDNAYSVNPSVSDYFYRMNQLYVGEIFTDHDRVKDLWESEYLVKNDTVSPYLYDSDKDADGDGWSNYAEFQAGTRPTTLGSLSVDAIQMDEYPIPTVELTLAYHGNQNIGDKPVVVKAWSDQTLATIPDAVWTLGGAGVTAVLGNGNSNVVTGVRYFGMNPMREMLLHFSPGSVVPGSVKFEFKDLSWVLVNTQTLEAFLSDPVTAIWEGGIIDQQRTGDSLTGDIVSQDRPDVSLGTIDYATGEVKLDFSKFPEELAIVGDISGANQGANWLSVYNLQKSYVRVNWQSKLITGGNVATYYLAEADRRDGVNNSLGHAKQGLNTFIAFYDFDGDGMYTPGEPYGYARNVDVDWNYAKVSIELTDTNVVVPRYKLTEGQGEATDREAMHIPGATDVYTISGGSVAPAMDNVRVRIARFAVDSMKYGALNADYMAVVYDRVLDLTPDGHPTITEADILNHLGNEFDLDWNAPALDAKQKSLQSVIDLQLGKTLANGMKAAFTNVFYTVYIGEGNITARDDSNTNGNMLVKTIVRKFGRTRESGLPVPISGSTQINTTAPTFTWRNPDTTYTAFRIKISGNGVNWTSDYQLMPPRDQNGVCSWTAPLRVGAVVPGGTAVFANGGTYTWSISTYNSRWRNDAFVPGGSFLVNVLESSQDYGTANVAVRYYGPSAVVSSGRPIRVQAFTTPDFSGEPVAEGYVSDRADIASTSAIKTANAKILGLKAGSYYIRAFVDTDQNGRLSSWTDQADCRSTWESWGCYCTRDTRSGTIFTPKSVTVGPGYGASEIIPVFIEDCDTDQDSLPDAWEWAQNGNLTAYGAAQIDQNAGGFAMRKALTQTLTAKGFYSTGLAVMTMTNLQSPRVAALLLGTNAAGSDSQVQSSLSSAGSSVSVDPVSVAITAIELDRESGTVKITTDTEGKQSGASAVTSEIYTIPSGAESLTLTCSVLHCDELGGSWKTIATKKVKIDRTTTDYTFDLSGDVDLSSGFFKVKLEK